MIAYGTDRIWPPRSPDLSPLDFWFWGPCETYVYSKQPENFEELKAYVAEYAASIPEDLVHRVYQNMRKRARACIEAEGGHFEHLLKQKNYDSDAPYLEPRDDDDDELEFAPYGEDDDDDTDVENDENNVENVEILVDVGILDETLDEEEETESESDDDDNYVPPSKKRPKRNSAIEE